MDEDVCAQPARQVIETSIGQRVEAFRGALQTQRVDVIVCPANSELNHGGGAAAALCKAAGPGLQLESLQLVATKGAVPVGSSCITSAFNLPCRVGVASAPASTPAPAPPVQNVVHTVAPAFNAGRPDGPLQLQNSVKSALVQSASVGAVSVAMCGIGSGIFGWCVA